MAAVADYAMEFTIRDSVKRQFENSLEGWCTLVQPSEYIAWLFVRLVKGEQNTQSVTDKSTPEFCNLLSELKSLGTRARVCVCVCVCVCVS